ncbi:hydroxymethylglutaryl-CoA lyase [Mumia sp. ZJ1417]|uniref:hydroxymethylglutaryl-CoA lyase n=1 Tax=Mumia sp. ZJ1417 TaxID=2708082 RepID=UPI001422050B|nr:hydroxymethylglutaryl-CoA lyase [Mumia sp. ZJ1417]QMW66499.1 hydroxymethylglutaryl-CoA lyase [Mumia sp. ZJ1417]
MSLPAVHRDPAMPERVTIYEVGARDGLQNEKGIIGLDTKLEFVQRLTAAGLPIVEATSFVHPKWVPQLADAADLVARLDLHGATPYPVLVPNERGLGRALDAGVTHVAIFGSATETFAQKNLNSTYEAQFAMFEPVVRRALDAGVQMRAYLSMCFGDPWEGEVALDRVVTAGKRLLDMGAYELSLGDTIGVGTAHHVEAMLDAFAAAGVPTGGVSTGSTGGGGGGSRIAMHFHDTYGQALANTYAALRRGVTTFDASAGGLGGCPYAKSATGNLATEDLVWMLDGLGVTHGVDLTALAQTSVWMAEQLGRPSPSAVVRALTAG